jgi:hypothetical protein
LGSTRRAVAEAAQRAAVGSPGEGEEDVPRTELARLGPLQRQNPALTALATAARHAHGAVTVAYAPTAVDLDWLASEMETGGTVVVVTPRITSALPVLRRQQRA